MRLSTMSSSLCWLTVAVAVLMAGDVHAQRRRNGRRAKPEAAADAQDQAPPPAAEAPPAPDAQAAPDAPAPAPATEPAPTPTPAQAAPETPSPDAVLTPEPDLAPLREEYTAIMDELVKARARVAIVGKALFKTKLRIIVQNRTGDAQSMERMTLRLDGAPVYRKDSGPGLEDGAQVFEGFATPGPHALDLELVQRSRADEAYGYTLRETYRIAVQKDRLTEITIVLDDDSDMAEDFPEDGEGEYDVRTRMTAATYELEAR